MPIVFNNDTTHKNDDTHAAHDPVHTRSAIARRTLSSGGLSRLKREAGTLSHHHSHPLLCDHGPDHDPAPSRDQDIHHGYSPLQKHPNDHFTPSETTDLEPAHSSEQASEKHTDVECSGPTFSLRHLRRDSVHDAEPGRQNQTSLDDARPFLHTPAERDRAASSPSPSLSPCPSTCSSLSAASSPSSPNLAHELLPRHTSPSPSAPTETAIIPLSPPASATATSPSPSTLSASASLDPQACSTDAPVSPSAPALTPLSSSQKRGSESGRPERFSKRRRSMDSLRRSPLPLENEDGQSKGECAVGPLSPLPAVGAASGMAETTADGPLSAAHGLGYVSDRDRRPASSDSPLPVHDGAPETAPEEVRKCEPVDPSPVTTEVHDIRQKPAISYATLISQAILESTRMKLTLGDIYSWIMTNYPYYRYSSSGWQNSIRHNLSLNKAFLKLDRTQDEPGKGCFWTLHEDAKESCAAATLYKKRKGSSEMNTPASIEHDASLNAAVAARSKGSTLPKLDCRASGLPPSRSQPAVVESVPSPAASEDAEDLKSPRRSGRARRPPRHKEAEDYLVHHARQPSLSGLSLSTPPSSPAPFAQDPGMNPTTAPTRKRAGSVRMERSSFASASLHTSGDGERSAVTESNVSGAAVTVRSLSSSSSTGSSPAPESALSSRTATRSISEAELTAIPGVVTSQRVRRPPQNLAEFVSSEDFKAAPFGCNKRSLQPSMSSSCLGGTTATAEGGRAAGKREKKRSKSEGQLWCSNSGKKATVAAAAAAAAESEMDNRDGMATRGRDIRGRDETAGADWISRSSGSQEQGQQPLPASVSLSALSHSKRANQDLRCFGRSKKAQRQVHNEQSALRRRIFERRRREGRREIMVASEDDWSDSDFDFLRDEEENYRLMRLRVERLQVGDHRFRRDEDDEEDEAEEDEEEQEGRKRSSGAEDEKIKLLMDPSVINYGFDSCDGEYILDYHQGPLFNNVTWPEFSDVKDDKTDKDEKDPAGSGSGSGSGNGNLSSSRNKLNSGGHGGPEETQAPDSSAAEAGVQDVDPSVVAEVISVLVGRAQQQQDLSPLTPMSPLSPLCTPNDTEPGTACMDEAVRAKEVGDMAQAWSSFVTKCAPAMQDSSSASRRSPGPGSSMDMHAHGKMDKSSSGVGMAFPLLAETELVVAVVTAVAVESDMHMADAAPEDAGCARAVVKEEIEAEDFIGWSLCD
ncbi:unnamed protein product [Mortierella alpina]